MLFVRGAVSPSSSTAKEKSCGCFAKAVESVEQAQFKTVSFDAYLGMASSTLTLSPPSTMMELKFYPAKESVATQIV